MHVICRPEHVGDARDLISDELERHHYPGRDIETLSETEELVEVAAALVPTSADAEELDTVVAHLERNPNVIDATWTVSTTG